MERYMLLVGVLNVAVNFLLLMGTSRLCQTDATVSGTFLAALLGGVHSCICLLPGFYFLGNMLWRIVFLVCMILIAFGIQKASICPGALFCVFSVALGGIAAENGTDKLWAMLLAAAGIVIVCIVGFRGKGGDGAYVPVELCYGERQLRLTALRDTGNTLRDPVTGKPVLVVGSQIAAKLLGLTLEQLKSPTETIQSFPGLRLIPYRSVGQPAGLLLAFRFRNMRVGNWKGSGLVAFAPHRIGEIGKYEALAGGMV